jgi:hypothetical protein
MEEYVEKKQQSLFNWNCLDDDFEEESLPDIRAEASETPEIETEPDWECLTRDCCDREPEPETFWRFSHAEKKMFLAQLEQINLLKEIRDLLKSFQQFD